MLSALYPVADLGLSRAAAKAGDVEKSRKAYEEFFRLWQCAGRPVTLTEAQSEYDRLMRALP